MTGAACPRGDVGNTSVVLESGVWIGGNSCVHVGFSWTDRMRISIDSSRRTERVFRSG